MPDQDALVIVNNPDRQIKGHGVDGAIHSKGRKYTVYKRIGFQVGKIQQHTGGHHVGHVTGGEDIGAVAVFIGENQILAVFGPVDALVIPLKRNVNRAAFFRITLLQPLGGGDDSLGDGREVIVVADFQGNRLLLCLLYTSPSPRDR